MENSDPLALSGYFMQPRRFLWSSKVSITILATQDDVSLIPYYGSRPLQSFTYADLHSASPSNFLGRDTIILHTIKGIITIYVRATRDNISELCRFVNRHISYSTKAPIGARFQLTKLEVTPENTFVPPPQDEYKSVMDALFEPMDWPELLFDDLDKNIEVIDGGAAEVANAPIVAPPSRAASPQRPGRATARNKRSAKGVTSQAPESWHAARNWAITLTVLIAFSVGIWWLDRLPGLGLMPLPMVETGAKEHPTDPAQLAAPLNAREAEQLIAILHDDARYAQLINIFKVHRLSMKLSARDVSSQLGWSSSDLSDIESVSRRADIIELINLALSIQINLSNTIKRVK